MNAASFASLAAAGIAVGVAAANPFDHDVWLVAYLVLVGFLAQRLLWRGGVAALMPGDEGYDARTGSIRASQRKPVHA